MLVVADKDAKAVILIPALVGVEALADFAAELAGSARVLDDQQAKKTDYHNDDEHGSFVHQ
jgi:hypothetical protein